MKNAIVTGLIALVAGFAGAAAWSLSGLGAAQTRADLVAHPEILPQLAQAYDRQQAARRLSGIADAVRQPFPGAVLGNPRGTRTLVKFTDYGCTYCRASVADVDALIAADPQLRVVIREWPIFEGSEQAARMGLAAAQQGKFARYYHALFEQGPPTEQTIARAAAAAGLDTAEARRFAASDAAGAELARTAGFAQTLGFQGTPAWVAGDEILSGHVGAARLAQALGSPAL